MIANLKPQTLFAIHLRAPSSSGGKDWVGSITAQGEIHTFWGKTGNVNQHGAKSGDIVALRRIITQKLNGKDKYVQVDEYHPQQGWQSQRTQNSRTVAKPAKVAPVTVPIVVWEDELPDSSIRWDF